MGRAVSIKAGAIEATAELNESRTAQAIWQALPIKGKARLWGDEIYFPVPVSLEPDEPQELVSVGDLAYWPAGSALCIFFGPTPVSAGQEIRPASPVNVFGRLVGDARLLEQVKPGAEIVVDRADSS